MAFRSKEIVCGLVLCAAASAAEFTVRHDHLRKGCTGTMTVDERGIAFQGPKHGWKFDWKEVQKFELGPDRIVVASYEDRKMLLGADRRLEFHGTVPREIYPMLKDRLDQRFVAALPDSAVTPLWEMPVKHLGRISGSQGRLIVGEDRIVYETKLKDDSRTWRLGDIQNISSSGPFELTITTFERPYRFQLKQFLSEARFDELWRRLNESNGRIQKP